MRGVTMKTPERVELARELREDGHLLREIGELLGVATSTVDGWLTDPEGRALRARKDRHAATCVDCGAPTSGSEGRRTEPRCIRCAPVLSGAERKVWTRAALIAAIQDWAVAYGEAPACDDWNPTGARGKLGDEERAARFEAADGRWPHANTVRREFGSWADGLIAAGFEPRAPHGGGGNMQRLRSVRAKAAA